VKKIMIGLTIVLISAFGLSYFGMGYLTRWATTDLKTVDDNYIVSSLKVAEKAVYEAQNANYNLQPAEQVQETAKVQVSARVVQQPAPARFVQPKNESVEFTKSVEPAKIAPMGCPYAEMMTVDDVKCKAN
jgi:hypothetical protein